jgi:carbon-monoxide dehydrogenase large subunit
MKKCLERVRGEFDQDRGSVAEMGGHRFPYGHWVTGRGVACIFKSTKVPTVSAAYVKIDEDGSASVVTSTVEVGQGAHTALMQMAGDILGLDAERMTVSFADTDVTPYDTSTTASRSTFHMGNAVCLAAEDAKRQVLSLAAPLLKSEREDLKLRSGSVWAPDGRSLTIAQVLKATFGAGAGAAILGKGVYTPEDVLGLEDIKRGKLEAYSSLSVFHGYAALGVEVAVDLDTGVVKILRLVAAHDVGKAVNPGNCRQQVAGALAMGLGYGLLEEYLWDKGEVLNANLLDYAVPTALDCPSAEIFIVEQEHPQGPFGAKGMGEMAIAHTAPAIANAIYNACGVRIHDLPLKPAKILKELRGRKEFGIRVLAAP